MPHVSCTSVVARGVSYRGNRPRCTHIRERQFSILSARIKPHATPCKGKNNNSKSDFNFWPRVSFLCIFRADTHRVAACSCSGPSLGTLARSEAHRRDFPSCLPVLCVLSLPRPLSCSSLTCTYALFGLFVCASVSEEVALPRRRGHSGPQFSACGRPDRQPSCPMISCALTGRHHTEGLFMALLFSLVLSARLIRFPLMRTTCGHDALVCASTFQRAFPLHHLRTFKPQITSTTRRRPVTSPQTATTPATAISTMVQVGRRTMLP